MELATGANKSLKDIRDYKHEQALASIELPPTTHRKEYNFHLNQRGIGICTAISVCTVMRKMYGIEFSPQFLYVMGKKIIDRNMIEGSSIRTMLQIANTIGVLPLSDNPQDDTHKSYVNYIDITFTDEQIQKASAYKLKYASARLDPVGFATDLYNSKYGLLTRQAVGGNTYQPSWRKSDLELMREPKPVTGGHAVLVNWYDGLDENQLREWHNTWGDKNNPTNDNGAVWSDDGNLKYKYSTQKKYVTEAWVVLDYEPITFKHTFTKHIKKGQSTPEVVALQRILAQAGYLIMPKDAPYGFYGNLTSQAVYKFQQAHGIQSKNGDDVGKLTIQKLNELYS